MSEESSSKPAPHEDGSFATTRWTLVRLAVAEGKGVAGEAVQALNELCHIYWYPLYCYARRRGYQPADAEDLVQGLYGKLLGNNFFVRADQTKGKLRGFLLEAFRNHMADGAKHRNAAKRGGDVTVLLLDTADAEARYAGEPADVDSPDKLYDRRWAMTVLQRALQSLRERSNREGKEKLFQLLEPYLHASLDAGDRRRVAGALAKSEDNVKITLLRLRERYRQAVLAEIAGTVSAEAEVKEELSALLAAVS